MHLPEKSLSLNQLFQTLEVSNSLYDQLGDPQLISDGELIIEEIADKIDRIHSVRCVFEDALSGMDARIERMKELRNSIASNFKRIDNIVLYSMQKYGADKIPGKEVRARLQYTQVCEPISPSPQLADCALWPQFVRTKYEWDKAAIKDAFKSGQDVGAVADVRKNPHLRWDIVSGLVKSKDQSVATNIGG